MKTPILALELLDKIDAYWRATNYLSVGQIYLYDNPLRYIDKHDQDLPEIRDWKWRP